MPKGSDTEMPKGSEMPKGGNAKGVRHRILIDLDGTQADSVYDQNGRMILSTDRYVPNSTPSVPPNATRTI